MKQFKSKNMHGFTTIELLLVVGFVSLALASTYNIFDNSKTANLVNSETHTLFLFRDAIDKYAANQQSYAGLSNTVTSNNGIAPVAIQTANPAVLANSFSGFINLSPINVGVATNNGYRITYDGLTSAVCTKLASLASSDFNQVTVNATIVKDYSASDTILNVASASAACNNPSNSISFDVISNTKNSTLTPGVTVSVVGAWVPVATPAPILPTVVTPAIAQPPIPATVVPN